MNIVEKREKLRNILLKMNENISIDSNYGAYRPAYHDEPDGSNSDIYLSNFYGIAMHSVDIEELTEKELDILLR